jgi:hypothetical protein
MYSIELTDEAISDYEKAVAWYEAQKPGLGFDFTVRLSDVFESIESAPKHNDFSTKPVDLPL